MIIDMRRTTTLTIILMCASIKCNRWAIDRQQTRPVGKQNQTISDETKCIYIVI